MRPSFFHHLHPPTIPARQARFRYTLGAGGISVYLLLVVILTGILEMFYYVPTPEQAAASIQTLTFLVPFGGMIRSLHYWGAQLLVAVSLLHLLRVLLTGAYTPPRRANYLIGLGLLVLILFLDFTGYILRWDEGIRWALVAGTNLVKTIPMIGNGVYRFLNGGDQPGPAGLVRFYAWHVFGLTIGIVIAGFWHLFRVRRDGGLAVPPPGARENRRNRITRATLVRREILAAVIASTILFLLAVFFPAPTGPALDLHGVPVSESGAPWFFLWVQQLLRWGDPFWFGVMVPLGILLFLGMIPFISPRPSEDDLGTWLPRAGRVAQIAALGLAAFGLILTIQALLAG